MLQTVTIENSAVEAERLKPLRPIGATAALIHRQAARLDAPLLYIAQTSRRAQDILDVLKGLDPARPVAFLPPWDCLPGDGLSPSLAVMGQRMSVLRWLTDARKRPAILLSTAAGTIRRVPPRSVWKNTHLEFCSGETIDPAEVEAHLRRIGYVFDNRVDEPGEAAIRGRVIDLFPAAAPRPCRVEHENGRITVIRSYDPVTQRSLAISEKLIVDPASEVLLDPTVEAKPLTGELNLARHYDRLETIFDYLPDAAIIIEDGVDRRADLFYEAVAEAAGETERQSEGAAILKRAAWSAAMGTRLAAVVEEAQEEDVADQAVPNFAAGPEPMEALTRYVEARLGEGWRLVLAAPAETLLATLSRRISRVFGRKVVRMADWHGVLGADDGALVSFLSPMAKGFLSTADRLVVVTARDLFGHQAGGATEGADALVLPQADADFAIGDAVVHFDHGVGILEGLESIGGGSEALRLRYAGDAKLLVPLSEIGAVWRYGGDADEVRLDRLKGNGWQPRRDAIVAAIRATAEGMVELAREKSARRAAPLRPDPLRFERFCSGFAYELTRDQSAAVDGVLGDLASGRPMDRLVCGDVGFGKTEVALRAVAATVFSGRQAAVVAPTTVLAQQHARLFARRFARTGIKVAQLSRLMTAAEIKGVKAGLADGSIHVVVGTHAVAGKGVSFADLALVVIDEEQRFGAAQKQALRRLGENAHVLAMTATPIPRTLQAGFVGLHDLSVIATPPVRRQPVATRVAPFEETMVREALEREKARGGQSFVVCPRIEDLADMEARLRAIVPDLSVQTVHGKMAPADLDRAMLDFAAGEGDVLLATNIIESGLDVAAANTMIVWRPDRFGLAQLHQIRGRVGRGSRRGVAILALDPKASVPEATMRRLKTLETLNRLGSGFEISARDLDMRGSGDLLGEEQAGHLQLIGVTLYRHFLERAIAVAQGRAVADDWRAELRIGVEGAVPPDYVPEPELRVDLASKLERIEDEAMLDVLQAEIEDRFGAMPEPLQRGFALARLRLRCKALDIRRLDAGPKALAATFALDAAERLKALGAPGEGLRWNQHRLVFDRQDKGVDPIADANAFLDRIAV